MPPRARSWDGKTLANLAIFVGLVPYAIYRTCVDEFNTVDRVAGRPEREMWGNSD